MTHVHHCLWRVGHRIAAALVLALGVLGVVLPAQATVDISSTPLSSSTASVVKPNLMFIMDDSGSMDWDFMPDWSVGGLCRATGATSTNSGSTESISYSGTSGNYRIQVSSYAGAGDYQLCYLLP